MVEKPQGEWLLTHTGVKFYFENPTPEMVKIEDIAYALAGINRFTGHTRITVAQHSVQGSYLVPAWDALEFLLHDGSEAYIGDLNKPLKRVLGSGYRDIATKLDRVVRQRFNLPLEESAIVKEVDSRICLTESRDNLGDLGCDKKSFGNLTTFPCIKIVPWSSSHAEEFFLRRFYELTTTH